MNLFQPLYYGTWLFVFVTLFYEAAARTNLRLLLKFGIPIYRQHIDLVDAPNLPDHIADLTERLNPVTAVPTGWNTVQKALLQPTSKNGFIVLPTSATEVEFRNGSLSRGRIVYHSQQNKLTISGFYTWPSLIMPLVIFLLSAFMPMGFFLIYLLLFSNGFGQRKQYQFVSFIVNSEFSNYQAAQLL
jgi:hypothetical protein